MKDTKSTFVPIFIPNLEIFCSDPIPRDAFRGYLVICGVYEKLYEYYQHDGIFPELFDKIDNFLKKHEALYADPFGRLEKDIGKYQGIESESSSDAIREESRVNGYRTCASGSGRSFGVPSEPWPLGFGCRLPYEGPL